MTRRRSTKDRRPAGSSIRPLSDVAQSGFCDLPSYAVGLPVSCACPSHFERLVLPDHTAVLVTPVDMPRQKLQVLLLRGTFGTSKDPQRFLRAALPHARWLDHI